jgi:hypothetical protein
VVTEPIEQQPVISLLAAIAPSNQDVVAELRKLNLGVARAARVAKLLLSLQKDRLRDDMMRFFVGKRGPKIQLVQLYLAVAGGKTRAQLVDAGFARGTLLGYCLDLLGAGLLEVKEMDADGQEVLAYTVVEELTGLSARLQELVGPNRQR